MPKPYALVTVLIALAQLNQTVGDINGNSQRIVDSIERAADAGAQLLCTPELGITGYPPEDLLLKRSFVAANRAALDRVAKAAAQVCTIVGFVDADDDALYNAAAICHGGTVVAIYRKQLLPNYGVFDEKRYFEPGRRDLLIDTPAGVIGVCVCEDLWSPTGPVVSQG
ncbi:MAG TPA: nitrilase-related carbon-nitrogen hydrolase, partial [Actinomycetota bacterium]|nr:nitrilase-related carbon-nitrogen hydrolase [Actinomycetota bacterium]